MSEYKSFRTFYKVAKVIFGLPFRVTVIGRENIPEGGAVLCANHTHWSDPFYLWFAVTGKYMTRIMAKAELFKIPVLRFLMKKLGVIPVDRKNADIAAIKTSLRTLKEGKKLGIFPEGTRVKTEGGGEAKLGALKIADRAGAPIVPVYIPREKKFFRKTQIVIGKPYVLNEEKRKLTQEEFLVAADDLMKNIFALQQTEK